MLFAWTNHETPDELFEAEETFPGLGFVLKGSNYHAVEDLSVPPIAYITALTQAKTVRSWIETGAKFTAVLVNDERNQTGPSGAYMEPADYAQHFQPVYDILHDLVPVHTMGLAPRRTWWWDMWRSRRFDDDYHAQLPDADGRAWNPNGVRRREVERSLRLPGPWILSPAPFRGWWDRFWTPVNEREWGRISQRENVTGVALWCLREVWAGAGYGDRWQSEHGLFDRHGNVTRVGRAVLAALE